MASGLSWLNDLMLWLGRWFPRIVLVKAGYVGVWFGRAGRSRSLSAGLYCYWPIVSDITVVSTRLRSTEIAAQLHGQEVIAIVVAFRVRDPLAALLHVNDLFSLLDDRAQAHLARAYVPDASSERLCCEVLCGLSTELEPHGIEIVKVDVAQRGDVIPVKMLNDYAQHAAATL